MSYYLGSRSFIPETCRTALPTEEIYRLTVMTDRWENLGISGLIVGGKLNREVFPWQPLLHLWQSLSLWLLFFTLHDGAPTNHGSKKALVFTCPVVRHFK